MGTEGGREGGSKEERKGGSEEEREGGREGGKREREKTRGKGVLQGTPFPCHSPRALKEGHTWRAWTG